MTSTALSFPFDFELQTRSSNAAMADSLHRKASWHRARGNTAREAQLRADAEVCMAKVRASRERADSRAAQQPNVKAA